MREILLFAFCLFVWISSGLLALVLDSRWNGKRPVGLLSAAFMLLGAMTLTAFLFGELLDEIERTS